MYLHPTKVPRLFHLISLLFGKTGNWFPIQKHPSLVRRQLPSSALILSVWKTTRGSPPARARAHIAEPSPPHRSTLGLFAAALKHELRQGGCKPTGPLGPTRHSPSCLLALQLCFPLAPVPRGLGASEPRTGRFAARRVCACVVAQGRFRMPGAAHSPAKESRRWVDKTGGSSTFQGTQQRCYLIYTQGCFLPAQWLFRHRCCFPTFLLLFRRRSLVHPSQPAARDWCTVVSEHGPYSSCPSLFRARYPHPFRF